MTCPITPSGRVRWLGRVFRDYVASLPIARSRIIDICIGRRLVYVEVEGGYIGVSFSPSLEPPDESIVALSLAELVSLAWQHPTLSSLALAGMSATLCYSIDSSEQLKELYWWVNLLDLIDLTGVRRLGMVGFIEPLAKAARRQGVEVLVYDDNEVHRALAAREGFRAFTGSQLLADIEDLDYIIASGSALIDPRLILLARRSGIRYSLVGPSSSIPPAVAKTIGAEAVCGCYIPPRVRLKVKTLVKLGYGFKKVSRLVSKWCYTL